MKAIARSYIWWPNLNAGIELTGKACEVCQAVRNAPPSAPLYPWRWPTRVWQRVHIDFAEKDGSYFLGLIDSHSKWIEVAHMRSTTAQSTIDYQKKLSRTTDPNSFPRNSLISLKRMELNKHWYLRTIHRPMGQQSAQSRSRRERCANMLKV